MVKNRRNVREFSNLFVTISIITIVSAAMLASLLSCPAPASATGTGASTSATVLNAATDVMVEPPDDDEPGIPGVQVNNPDPSTNKMVTVTATISDLNGWDDVVEIVSDSLTASITGPGGFSIPVNLNFYQEVSETITIYTGSFNMSDQFRGEYQVQVSVTDTSGSEYSGSESFTYPRSALPAPFIVFGCVNDTAGEPVNNPLVRIKNLNTSAVFTAERDASSNYYQVITSAGDVLAGDVLHFFNATGFNHVVTEAEMNNGGLFNYNITLAPSAEKPDLVISDTWVCWPDNCTICYNVTNIGTGTAPAGHNTALYVDGKETACDIVPVTLAPNASDTICFNYTWVYTHDPNDNITVCADNNDTVDEFNGYNNCLIDTWMCGDMDGDGFVTVYDSYLLYIGDIGTSEWAADVDHDKYITVYDSYLLYIGALNCKCSS